MTYSRTVASLRAGVCGTLLLAAVACAAEERSYSTPTAAELAQAGQLFRLLLQAGPLEDARVIAGRLGLALGETPTSVTLVDERGRGWGEYSFSKRASKPIALQAPHRFHDRHTGELARRLFDGGAAGSVALNSVSRRTPVAGQEGKPADLARLHNSLHSVHAAEFSALAPRGYLVQLHGFDAARRKTDAARAAHIILSSGSREGTPYLSRLQRCFEAQGWNTLRYPEQVRELGATRNSVGALLRGRGHRGFTHIEMNLDLRRELLDDTGTLQAFGACLAEALS